MNINGVAEFDIVPGNQGHINLISHKEMEYFGLPLHPIYDARGFYLINK